MFKIQIDENLELRPIHPTYAKEFLNLIRANKKHLKLWFPKTVKASKNIELLKKWIRNSMDKITNEEAYLTLIFYRDKIAGCAGFSNLNTGSNKGELSYWIAKQYQGKAIASKSIKALIKFGFKSLNLNRIQIKAAETNLKSRAIPEKLGFTLEGVLREYRLFNKRYFDSYIYSILEKEWSDLSI